MSINPMTLSQTRTIDLEALAHDLAQWGWSRFLPPLSSANPWGFP